MQNASSLEFYGQRPWRPGKACLDPPDLQKEKEGVEALQYRERTKTRHSALIMELQALAIRQFETFSSPRMTTQLTVQMALELVASHDYGRALATLLPCLDHYRRESWPRLLVTVLHQAVKCAYLTASVPEYAGLCLELAGPQAQVRSVPITD